MIKERDTWAHMLNVYLPGNNDNSMMVSRKRDLITGNVLHVTSDFPLPPTLPTVENERETNVIKTQTSAPQSARSAHSTTHKAGNKSMNERDGMDQDDAIMWRAKFGWVRVWFEFDNRRQSGWSDCSGRRADGRSRAEVCRASGVARRGGGRAPSRLILSPHEVRADPRRNI